MNILIKSWADNVITWNKACGKDCNIPKESKHLQLDLIDEEYKEVVEAMDSPDVEDFIAEVCDLFVVSSFAYYLYMGTSDIETTPVGCTIDACLEAIESNIMESHHLRCYNATINLINIIGIENVSPIMEAKLSSNWSKLPTVLDFHPEVGAVDLEEAAKKECERLEKEYKGRYNGIKSEVITSTQSPRVVFKDSKGKVLKPYTYKDWKECVKY